MKLGSTIVICFSLAFQSVHAQMFSFSITCTASAMICQQMTATLKTAGARLEKVLKIRVPIIAQINLSSFGASKSNVLGEASPASFGLGRTSLSKPFVQYPQALLKQLDTTTDYTGVIDIAANFNTDFNFWFKSSGVPITSTQFDFEYVACHELTHGLGFIDDLFTSFSGSSSAPTFLIPTFYVDGTQSLFEGWVNTGAFTQYMWDYNYQTYIYKYYAALVNNYIPNNYPLSTMDTKFASSGIAYTAGKYIRDAVVSLNLKFVSQWNSVPIALYSPAAYTSGSSVAHTDFKTYRGGPDFLMTYTIADAQGVTLDSILAKNQYNVNADGPSIYGPSTLAVMASLGWVTALNPNETLKFYPYDINLDVTLDLGVYCYPLAATSGSCPLPNNASCASGTTCNNDAHNALISGGNTTKTSSTLGLKASIFVGLSAILLVV